MSQALATIEQTTPSLDEILETLNKHVFPNRPDLVVTRRTQLMADLGMGMSEIMRLQGTFRFFFPSFCATQKEVSKLVTVGHCVNLVWTRLQPPLALTHLDYDPTSERTAELIALQFGGSPTLLHRQTNLRDNLDADLAGIVGLLKKLEAAFALDFHNEHEDVACSLVTVQDCIDLTNNRRAPSARKP